MENTLKMLVNMHKQIEIAMAHENAKNNAIIEETMLLQKTMTEEIKADLMEIYDCYKKLNIKTYIFQTSIELNPLRLSSDNCDRSYCIGFNFGNGYASMNQIGKLKSDSHSLSMYGLFNTKNPEWDNQYACNEVYKHWKEIKQELEQKIIEAYFKEQNGKFEKINNNRESAMNMLNATLELLKM